MYYGARHEDAVVVDRSRALPLGAGGAAPDAP